MQGMAGLVTHQRKAASEHAAIGQSGEQLAAGLDAGVEPQHERRQRALRAVGQTMRALALAGNRVALRLGIGEL